MAGAGLEERGWATTSKTSLSHKPAPTSSWIKLGFPTCERAFCDRIGAGMHLWPRSEQSVKQRGIGEVL
jgi:hypothetical protein